MPIIRNKDRFSTYEDAHKAWQKEHRMPIVKLNGSHWHQYLSFDNWLFSTQEEASRLLERLTEEDNRLKRQGIKLN